MRILTPEQFMRHTATLSARLNRELGVAREAVGENAVKHFKKSFERGGFAGESKKWTPRKRRYSHKPLVKTGKLKRSISKSYYGRHSVRITAKASYGIYHNAPAGMRQGRTFSPNIQRKFIGNSAILNKSNAAIIRKALNRTFKYRK